MEDNYYVFVRLRFEGEDYHSFRSNVDYQSCQTNTRGMNMEQEQGEELTEYKLDIILAETQKSYYGIIDGVTVEPKWVPKRVVGKDFRIESWYVKLIKEGKTEWEPKEKKMKQVKLTNFVTLLE